MDKTTKFIPKAKLSKKARKKLNDQSRLTWAISPTTRKADSKKIYNRKNAPHRYDAGGIFAY